VVVKAEVPGIDPKEADVTLRATSSRSRARRSRKRKTAS
jgi:hypothetical protein